MDDTNEDVELEDECVLVIVSGEIGFFPVPAFAEGVVVLEGSRRAIFSIEDPFNEWLLLIL